MPYRNASIKTAVAVASSDCGTEMLYCAQAGAFAQASNADEMKGEARNARAMTKFANVFTGNKA
jgi:hypothetical protein